MTEGRVNLPADLARVFFTIVTRESLAAADARNVALTVRAEKAEAIIKRMNEADFHQCAECEKCFKRKDLVHIGMTCGCVQDPQLALLCFPCNRRCTYAGIKNKVSCETCTYDHKICAAHTKRAYCAADGCDGGLYSEIGCETECRKCDTCSAPACRRHSGSNRVDTHYCLNCMVATAFGKKRIKS
jgi:hypothetical protein